MVREAFDSLAFRLEQSNFTITNTNTNTITNTNTNTTGR